MYLFRLVRTDLIVATFVVVILFFCLTFQGCEESAKKRHICFRAPMLFFSRFIRVFAVTQS